MIRAALADPTPVGEGDLRRTAALHATPAAEVASAAQASPPPARLKSARFCQVLKAHAGSIDGPPVDRRPEKSESAPAAASASIIVAGQIGPAMLPQPRLLSHDGVPETPGKPALKIDADDDRPEDQPAAAGEASPSALRFVQSSMACLVVAPLRPVEEAAPSLPRSRSDVEDKPSVGSARAARNFTGTDDAPAISPATRTPATTTAPAASEVSGADAPDSTPGARLLVRTTRGLQDSLEGAAPNRSSDETAAPTALGLTTSSLDVGAIASSANAAAMTEDPISPGSARQTLVQVLGERLHVQLTQGAESATIRLTPPSMGTIDIAIRHEGGIVQIHLTASNADVLSQLRGIGEAVRQDLVQRQSIEVRVHVSEGSREGDEQRHAHAGADQEEPGRALHDEAGEEPSGVFSWPSHREA